MYLQHFKLQSMPFSLTPDSQFFYPKASHQEALNTILIALQSYEGFVKVVGEVGTGKTMLCRKLLHSLNREFKTAYIPNPLLTPVELKSFLAEEIGAQINVNMAAHEMLLVIFRRLIKLANQGKQLVLIIDEAQAMPRDTIETLRLLTNLETEKRKLMQIVLIGQPELDLLLDRPDLRQLKQRIVFNEYLRPLPIKIMQDYINHRLKVAGYNNSMPLFSPAAFQTLYRGSQGIPRLANIICHKALLCAYGKGDPQVKVLHIKSALQDNEKTSQSRNQFRRLLWQKIANNP